MSLGKWVNKLKPNSLRSQLVLGIALIYFVLMSVFVLDISRRQYDFLKTQSRTQVMRFANVMASNASLFIVESDIDRLQKLLESYNTFPHLKYSLILDKNGTVLANSQGKGIGYKLTDEISKHLNYKSQNEQILIDDSQMFDIASPIKENNEVIGWFRICIDKNFITKDITRIFRNGIVYVLFAMLIGSFFAILMARRITFKFNKLISVAKEIEKGNKSVLVPSFRTLEMNKLAETLGKILNELKSNELFLSSVIETMPVGVWILDKDGKVLSKNAEGKKIWQGAEYVDTTDEPVYKGRFVETGKNVEPHEWSSAITVVTKQPVLNQEVEIECFDKKTIKTILGSSSPIFNSDGELVGIIVTNIDISGTRKIEKDLIDYKHALDQSAIVTITDENGIIEHVNDYFCKISKFSEAELLGKDYTIIDSGYHPKSFFDSILQIIKKGEIWRGEIKNMTKDGTDFWTDTIIIPFLDEKNKPYQYITLKNDITDKKIAEQRLQKINHDIGERMKELKCLYQLSELSNNKAIGILDMLKECVKVIPPAYQYPEHTVARISFNEVVFVSNNFVETIWKQETAIKLNEQVIGKVEVFYARELPFEDEGPFLKEERFLINSIAEILTSTIERKGNEKEILQLSRLYQFISLINEALVRDDEINQVYKDACEIAVKYGNAKMAWFGVYNETNDTIEPIVWAGDNENYLTNIIISLRDSVTSKGPSGRVLSTGNYYYCNDIENDPNMLPWREKALKRGYRSSISLPIKVNGEIISIFTIYMQTAFFFNNAEVELLKKVADDIAFAADKLRIRDVQKQYEKELQLSEAKFRSLVEQSLVGVYILQGGNFVYINSGFEMAIGYSKEELLTTVTFEQLIFEEDLPLVQKSYLKRISGEEPTSQYSFRAVKKDGSIMHVEIFSSQFVYNGEVALIGTIVDITSKIEEEMRIGKAVIDAQEKERIQIGMELHDNVQQLISASLINIGFANKYLESDVVKTSSNLQKIKQNLLESLGEVRRLSHQLAPSINLSNTLEEKIKYLINSFDRFRDKNIELDIVDLNKTIPEEIQVAIYRILQEQLNNILKYAKATKILIQVLVSAENVLTVIVKDDGVGFDATINSEGIGLENISRRSQLLGGSSKVISTPGDGCSVIVQFPLK